MTSDISKQTGLVMVLALLVLMTLTILGTTSVTSSLLQSKMAISLESQSLAFDAAEAAIAGVAFESEDTVLLGSSTLVDPLSEARQGAAIDLADQDLSCYNDESWVNRTITESGLATGVNQTLSGAYNSTPEVSSWSRTAFIKELACKGSSNVVGGSNINCHVFIIRGCGKLTTSSYAVANTLTATTFAPASQ